MTIEARSLPEMLSRASTKWPKRNAIIDNHGAVSYEELSIFVSAVSVRLIALGIVPRDRVAVLLQNSRCFVAAHFGVLAIGAVSVPLNAGAAVTELEDIVRSSQPLVLITDRTRYARIRHSDIAALPWLHILIAEEWRDPARFHALKSWAFGNEIRIAARDSLNRKAYDLLMFTGGTSGAPKGVMLRHQSVLSVIGSVASFVGYDCRDVELIALPLSHSFGLGQLYSCLANGACACISVDLVFPARASAEAHRLQATGISCTPVMLNLLLKSSPEFFSSGRSNLKYCIVNSAPVQPELVAKVSALRSELRFFHYYGLTEASRTTFICFNDFPTKIGSVGRPMPHAKIKILDEFGLELTRGLTGEIAVSGDALFCGYWRDSEHRHGGARDDWFHTGDIGYLDEDGFLFLVGRLGDTINVDGQKFHPTEVEEVMLQVNGVSGAGVVAVPDLSEDWGVRIVGVVAMEPGVALKEYELRAVCSRKLQSYKVPRAFVAVDAIPHSQSGKIDRTRLRKLVENSHHR